MTGKGDDGSRAIDPSELIGRRRDVTFVIIGIVVVVLSVAAAVIAGGFVGWAHSVCNSAAADVAAKQSELRRELPLIWTGAAVAPTVWFVLARRTGRRAWPWMGAACGLLAVGVYEAVFARPSAWCLF